MRKREKSGLRNTEPGATPGSTGVSPSLLEMFIYANTQCFPYEFPAIAQLEEHQTVMVNIFDYLRVLGSIPSGRKYPFFWPTGTSTRRKPPFLP